MKTRKQCLVLLLVVLLIGVLTELTAGPGGPLAHELYWHNGLFLLTGPERTVSGVGGGPGYRYHLSPGLALLAEVRYLVYAGNSFVFNAGLEAGYPLGSWHPAVGLLVGTVAGTQIRTFNSARAQAVSWPPLVLLFGLAPLRFGYERFTATALSLRLGISTSREKPATVFSLTVLEVGLRF